MKAFDCNAVIESRVPCILYPKGQTGPVKTGMVPKLALTKKQMLTRHILENYRLDRVI